MKKRRICISSFSQKLLLLLLLLLLVLLLTNRCWRPHTPSWHWHRTLVLLKWKPLVGGVAKRGSHDHHGTRSQKSPHNTPSYHLPLPACQIYGQPSRRRWGWWW